MSIATRVDIIAHRAKPMRHVKDSPHSDVPRTTITIDPVLPDLEITRSLMDSDAKAIVDALAGALPGGTLDRITALLLQRKISHLVVR